MSEIIKLPEGALTFEVGAPTWKIQYCLIWIVSLGRDVKHILSETFQIGNPMLQERQSTDSLCSSLCHTFVIITDHNTIDSNVNHQL